MTTSGSGRWCGGIANSHFEGRILGRSGGFSALNAVAYGLGTQLINELTGNQTRDYTDKPGFIAAFILAPVYAPAWIYDPVKLASYIDAMEPRCDSQLLREFVISMPVELETEQQQALARELVETLFVARGMIGMVFLHDESKDILKDKPNPHIHVMLTMRELEENGTFGKKCREWNEHANMLEWRKLWAEITNKHLEMAGSDARVDHRSLAEQGHGLLPTEKLSRAEIEMKKRGIPIAKDERNKEIRAINQERQALLQQKTAEWEVATQMVRGLATVATKKWEMSKMKEALEQTFTTWVEQVKETMKQELEAQQQEIFRQVAASEKEKEEKASTLQHDERAYHRVKHPSWKPSGWKVKAKQDWPSKRKQLKEPSADSWKRQKQENQKQAEREVEKARMIEAERETQQQVDTLQYEVSASHRKKRTSWKPNGWKIKAQKDWQSIRKRFVEKAADEYPRQPREQQKQVTREAEQERVPQADTPQKSEQEAYRRAKRVSVRPNGWRVKAQKDWPSTRARLKEQWKVSGVEREKERQVEAREHESVQVNAEPVKEVGFAQRVHLLKQEDTKQAEQERLSRFIRITAKKRVRLEYLQDRLQQVGVQLATRGTQEAERIRQVVARHLEARQAQARLEEQERRRNTHKQEDMYQAQWMQTRKALLALHRARQEHLACFIKEARERYERQEVTHQHIHRMQSRLRAIQNRLSNLSHDLVLFIREHLAQAIAQIVQRREELSRLVRLLPHQRQSVKQQAEAKAQQETLADFKPVLQIMPHHVPAESHRHPQSLVEELPPQVSEHPGPMHARRALPRRAFGPQRGRDP